MAEVAKEKRMTEALYTRAAFEQFKRLPTSAKVRHAQIRIRSWYQHCEGNVSVSFSGGKDSLVLLHIVRSMYPSVPAVFFDTGQEFPETRQFIKGFSDVEFMRPKKRFPEIIEQYGYPVIGKEVARTVYYAKKGSLWAIQKLDGCFANGTKRIVHNFTKWKFLLDAPFAISDVCCQYLKKNLAHQYGKESGNSSIIGTLAIESDERLTQWMRHGCNLYDSKRPISKPLSIWTDKDIWAYIRAEGLSVSPIYEMGYERTGCIFCMFGCHRERQPNRFQRLQWTHPTLYDYGMRPRSEHGLGLASVLDYLRIPYTGGVEQTRLFYY